MTKISLLVSLTLVAAVAVTGCMARQFQERYQVMSAAQNQANRWIGPMACGMAGEQGGTYLERQGDVHSVLVCGFPMLCKKDPLTMDGYTCVDRAKAPPSWLASSPAPTGVGP